MSADEEVVRDPVARAAAKADILDWMQRSHKGFTVYQVMESLKAENKELRAALREHERMAKDGR